jgi:hypothetical protein
LGALYAVWYLHYSRSPSLGFASDRPSLHQLWSFVWSGETGVVTHLGHYRVVALGLVVMLVVGLGVAWVPLTRAGFRRVAGPVLGLFAGTIVLFVAVAFERLVLGPSITRSSRYVDIAAVFVAPGLAVAADALIRRWRWSAPVVAALFLVEIPANATQFPGSTFPPSLYRNIQVLVIGAGYSPIGEQVPGNAQPAPGGFVAPKVDMAFIRRAKAEGKFPGPIDLTRDQRGVLVDHLGLDQGPASHLDGLHCTVARSPLPITLTAGEGLRLDSSVLVAAVVDGQPAASILHGAQDGVALTARAPSVDLVVSPAVRGTPYAFCQR